MVSGWRWVVGGERWALAVGGGGGMKRDETEILELTSIHKGGFSA